VPLQPENFLLADSSPDAQVSEKIPRATSMLCDAAQLSGLVGLSLVDPLVIYLTLLIFCFLSALFAAHAPQATCSLAPTEAPSC